MEQVNSELLFGKLLKYYISSKNVTSPSVWAGHDAKGCEGREKDYMESRRPSGKDWNALINDIDILWYQRNYLKCVVDI